MTDTLFSRNTGVRQASFQMQYLDEVAETIRDDAISQAREKLGAAQCGADLDSLLRRSDFFDYFKHGLASGVVNVLAAQDQDVQVVYTYDPSMNPDNETGEDLAQDPAVHLIVLVTTPTTALEVLVASLDRALTASLKELASPRFTRRESVLDLNLVTVEDVRLGVSYAGLLSGLFASPLKIWQRE